MLGASSGGGLHATNVRARYFLSQVQIWISSGGGSMAEGFCTAAAITAVARLWVVGALQACKSSSTLAGKQVSKPLIA
jgi:hypothetical protein